MKFLRQAIVASLVIAPVVGVLRKKSGQSDDDKHSVGNKVNAPRAAQQHLYREIVDARIASAEKRAEQFNTRAGVLIASAALSASLGSTSNGNGWTVLSLLLTLAAAGLGVLTLFPKKSDYVSLQSLRPQLLKLSPSDAELLHADEQAKTYANRVKSLAFQGWCIRFGFSLLAASIIARAALALNVAITTG